MPDLFLYAGQASPADVKLTDTTVLSGAAPITGVSAVTQAAAVCASTLAETFSAVGASTQAPATCASVLVETFAEVGVSTQAAAIVASTVVETFASVAASTQAKATPAATVAETFSAVAASTQAKATPAATLTETFSAIAASTQAKATPASTLTETFASVNATTQGVPVLSASGVLIFSHALASTQAAATLSAQIAQDNGSRTVASASTQAVAHAAITLHADWPVFRGWVTTLDTVTPTTGHTGWKCPVGRFPGTFLSVYVPGTTTLAPGVWPNPTLVNPDGSFQVRGDALAYDLKFWRSEIP